MEIQFFNYGQLSSSAGRAFILLLSLIIIFNPPLATLSPVSPLGETHIHSSLPTLPILNQHQPVAGPSQPAETKPAVDGVSQNWWSATQQNIRQAEYNLTWQTGTYLSDLPAAYQAPNRAHNLRTYFTPEGIRIIPRVTENSPAWEWNLSLRGYGYADNIQPVSQATLTPNENRMDYQRGALTEWYLNAEKGLEQGFTLETPPAATQASAKNLVFEFSLSGNLKPTLSADGQTLDFFTPGGVRVLRYSDLYVTDAKGLSLPASLSLSTATKNSLRIIVDSTSATYPITIDPLTTAPAWGAEGNQTSGYLGTSVGTAGDVNGDGYDEVLVGAYPYDNGQADEGQAFLYYGSATGLSSSPNWTAESNQNGGQLGTAVGTAGDINNDGYDDVILGAFTYDNGQTDEGAAFVWYGSATGLGANGTPANADWTAESNQTNAQFGISTGTAGDVNNDGFADVIVGAVYYDNGQSDEGGAFVWHGSATGLGTNGTPVNADWRDEGDANNAEFGLSSGTAGDVNDDGYSDIVVGATYFNAGGGGQAYAYYGSAAGLSTSPDWNLQDDQGGTLFGNWVSTAGDVNNDGYADVLVAAPRYSNGQSMEGRVYAYYGSGSGLNLTPDWSVESDQDSAEMGLPATTAGDVNGDGYADVFIVARRYDNGESDEGIAYIYQGSATGLSLTPNWTAEGNQVDALFGGIPTSGTGAAGDVNGDGYADVIIGSGNYDNDQTNDGLVLVWYGSPLGLGATADWTGESDQSSAWLGISVSTAGDVNKDGYSDVIIGADGYDNGQADEGAVFVWQGSASGLGPPGTPTNATWMAEGNQAGAQLGGSVSTAGDVNGDGYADILVGAYLYDNGQVDEGRVFVWHGSASGLGANGTPANADWTAESNQANAQFGASATASTAGDINGDGYSDIIIGAYAYDNSQTDEGEVFVWHGSASGLGATGTPANADWLAESNQVSANLGNSVGTAGDVNGDGYADVIITAYLYDGGQTDEGTAFVWYGSATGLGANGTPSNMGWKAESNQVGAGFGTAVVTAGDVNGDGYADILIGAVGYDNGQTNEGTTFVWYGSATGLGANGTPANADWRAESDQDYALFGGSLSPAGDVNGDGYADILIGALFYDNGETDEGAAFVWYGSATGLGANGNPTNAVWFFESNQVDAWLGISASTAGDVNGDGYADLLLGASRYDSGEVDEGFAFLYYGGAGSASLYPNWATEGNQASALFGCWVNTAGDVNGDGYADVLVGAYAYDNGETDEGRVYLYYGSATGLNTVPSWTAESNQNGGQFGITGGLAGDVNGDGYADVIVGDFTYDNGQADEGTAYAWYGSASGLGANGTPANADWMAESNQANAQFGRSAGTAGDVNGDGYADVVVGALYYDNGQNNEGRVYVYYGSATGLSPSANWTAEGNANDAEFGFSTNAAGDVNGDGYSDLIVGADYYWPGGGHAYAYYGSASGLSTSPDWNMQNDQSASLFGNWVSTAGDVNGDGYADVLVGAPFYSNGQSLEGRAYLYSGSGSGLSLTPDWIVESDQANARLGNPVSTAGDVNGDGYADVLIAATSYGQSNSGQVYLYHGSAIGLSPLPDWTAAGDQTSDLFGLGATTAGDVNGDGYADIIIGAQNYDNGETDEGSAFVYYGNAGPGLGLNPRQRRGNDSAPVAQLGSSYNTAFHLRLLGRTPFGRSRVKLEWEVKPLGVLFDGTGIQQSASWLNTGTAGVQLNALVNNLVGHTAYHWRVRLHYHPASTPFQQYSRWLTTPWNGWNETRLQTGDPGADLSISKSDGQTTVTPGSTITYTIVISNPSPIVVANAAVTDTFPTTLVGVNWTCSASAGSACTASGSGSINQIVMLAAGGAVTFTATSLLTTTATGTLSNTAYVAAPPEANDPNSSNDSATDTDTISAGCTPLVPPLIYSNTFGGSAGSEWSNTSTDLTPTNRRFLGQFGNQTVSLTLNCLPAHTHVGVAFDLFIIRSWDGNLAPGPDIWELNATGGALLSHTTFTNWNVNQQAYPGTYPGGDYPAHAGATEINTLGYTYSGAPMDSVYHLNYLFSHGSASLALNFLATGLHTLGDESWGIDNIEVTVKTLPYNTYVPFTQK